ncbi:MAG TPA: carboxypeptidase-like regulatory domain-containing protein [Vicinamibacterales bacterium]|nr:carboxypeptidase-like regulatory domain-containing protein [Vicinamibacterales bacterium]
MDARVHLTLGILAWTLLAYDASAQPAALAPPNTGGRLSGRVISSRAGLVADAIVTLARLDATGASIDRQTTTSDRQGLFNFERVPSGRYQLSASKPGFTNRHGIAFDDPIPDQPGAVARARFETSVDVTLPVGGQVTGLELRLRRAAAIAGRIAEPDGIPAPDVQVFAAARRDSGYALLPDTQTTSEWDGRYEIRNLPPGEYFVLVLPNASPDPGRALANAERRAPEAPVSTRPAFAATLYPGVSHADRAHTVTVLEGVAAEGIDVWLTPAQRFSISGRVLWPDGLAVDNIAIEYNDLNARRPGLWTVSDPGGLFTITGVAAGTLVLLARADSAQGPLAGAASTEVTVAAVEDLRLTLGTPGMVEGRLVYEAGVPASARPTSIALRQRLIQVSALYPIPESAIGADGRFQISPAFGEYEFELRGLPAGLRIKRVSRDGRPVADGRIGVGRDEAIAGVEIVVGR